MIDIHVLCLVKDWAVENHKKFKPNGFGRQYGVLQELDPPKEAWEIRKHVVELYSLGRAKQEPCFKDYCGYITDGGAIHRHKDGNEGELIHTRFNVMVSKPHAGGEPIQDGRIIEVNEGDVWRCDAGLVEHWCNPVIGIKPRIVLSFGFLV